jgi:hypothetical protein
MKGALLIRCSRVPRRKNFPRYYIPFSTNKDKGAETYLLACVQVCAGYEFSKLLIIINYKSMGAE